MLYVVTLSDTFPLKHVAFTYLHAVVFENVLCAGPRYNLIHCSSLTQVRVMKGGGHRRRVEGVGRRDVVTKIRKKSHVYFCRHYPK